MLIRDLSELELYTSREITQVNEDKETHPYLVECLRRFYTGDFGALEEDDIRANLTELREGEGHVLARYEKKHNLRNDIYVEAIFSESRPGGDFNKCLVMYVDER